MNLNICEAKTHLSEYLAEIEETGETIILCRRNEPVAEIRALPKKSKKSRPIGLDKGRFTVPDDFNDPLPEDIMKYFNGDAPDPDDPLLNR